MTDKKDWYSPGAIYFTRRSALWLVKNLGTLLAGYWPPEASNYIDMNIRTKGVSRNAPYSIPVEYAAEIETRLEKCGNDGLILEARECWGKSDESLARYLGKPAWSIKKRAKTALGYITGKCRRWIDCPGREGCICCKTCPEREGCKKEPCRGESYRDYKKRNGKSKNT